MRVRHTPVPFRLAPAVPARRITMGKTYEGLPAARNVEQSIILAQLQVLRHMEAIRAATR